MKKIKFQKKLSLNKEIITKLNDTQMEQLKGGAYMSGRHCTTKTILRREIGN